MRLTHALAAIAAAALLAPASAVAATYPPPSNPGKATPRSGKAAKLNVCKQRKCRYHTIQSAVNAAHAGDKIAVADGAYREGVKINGHGKDGISLTGDTRKPTRAFINAKGKQNGIIVNGADGVTMDGFSTKNYSANGFFV